MNISCEISSTDQSNFSGYSACNDAGVDNDYEVDLVSNIMTVLLCFPINSYVIWLIVRGTGNGLAAEFFIFHLSVCEILYCIECFLALFCNNCSSMVVIDFLEGISITGRPVFQCVICVERYLAVIHPVIFLKYKPLRYRLMCSAVVWVTSFCSCIFSSMTLHFSLIQLYFISYFVQFFLFLSIQLFCCVAVLRALKQSGPGERGREREEENHMKRRAFQRILLTVVATVITYVPQITAELLEWISGEQSDILRSISYDFFLLAGLVQPLLFLYRVGKLNFIKCH